MFSEMTINLMHTHTHTDPQLLHTLTHTHTHTHRRNQDKRKSKLERITKHDYTVDVSGFFQPLTLVPRTHSRTHSIN